MDANEAAPAGKLISVELAMAMPALIVSMVGRLASGRGAGIARGTAAFVAPMRQWSLFRGAD